jgi:hypothetical protein
MIAESREMGEIEGADDTDATHGERVPNGEKRKAC